MRTSAKLTVAATACTAIVALLQSLTGCSGEGPEVISPIGLDSEPGDRMALPAMFMDGYVILQADIEGAGPYRLLLDTGADQLILDQSLAMRVRRARFQRAMDEGRRPEVVAGAALATIDAVAVEIGDRSLGTFTAQVVDLSNLNAMMTTPIDGLAGFNLFQDRVLSIDYAAQRVMLTRGPAPRGIESLQIVEPGQAVVRAQLGTVPFNVVLDTGSSPALVVARQTPDAAFLEPPTPVESIQTIGGEISNARRGTLRQPIFLGGLVFSGQQAILADRRPTIGIPILSQFIVHFDQRRNVVIFEEPSSGQ